MTQLLKKDFDIVIVGAGIAGSSLAHASGNLGYKVQLIERNLSEPGS
jgi:flavin-dependent dehydrogenase